MSVGLAGGTWNNWIARRSTASIMLGSRLKEGGDRPGQAFEEIRSSLGLSVTLTDRGRRAAGSG